MGTAISMCNANWPMTSAKWSVDQMPDMSDKVILITGGNSGIGKETVKALLYKKAKVYIASHSETRVKATIQELKELTGQEALFIELELSSLSSVRAAAQQFQQQESKLHVLFNNAGVMLPDPKAFTAEGHDLQFGVNVLGHYYLTQLLLPQLTAAGSSRVMNLTSHGHILVDSINYDALKDGPIRDKLPPLDIYNQSKFANVVMSSEFARRYGDRGIAFMAVHPGLIISNLGRTMSQTVVKTVHLLSYDCTKGALTGLWGATSPEMSNANGKYLIPWARVGNPQANTLTPENGTKLWAYLEEQIKNFEQ